MADLIGQRIGQYEIVARLGEGGMATVYRARQLNVKREVAIKVIRPDHSQSEDFALRFAREAQAIASLSHPYILKLFDYGEHDKMLYLVTELLTGGSLGDLIRKESLPFTEVQRLFDQMASALDYAHQRQIVHRDLKPQNVLLDENKNAFLADFGIAKLLSEDSGLTQTGSFVGTPAYMAPEQWRGEPSDPRSDLYALGVMLFQMLVNRLPFTAETPYAFMQMHIYETPPPLGRFRTGMTFPIEKVMERALAKDPQQRFQSAGALAAAFKAALLGEKPPTQPLTPPPMPLSLRTPPPSSQSSVPLTPTELEAPTISPSQAAEQERRALQQIESEVQNRSQQKVAVVQTTFINALPQDISERFKDRSKAQADIVNLLMEKTRLVSIYGRGGVGKTALACKVLGDLQQATGAARPDGMIYMSSTSTGISLDRVLTDFGKLLTGPAKDAVVAAQSDPKLTVAQKVAALFGVLGAGRYVLLLDNLESLQDPETGQLTDPEMAAFFEAVMSQGSGLRIVVTSREPLTLPRPLKTWERLIVLDEGLPVEDAVELLRTFDPDAIAGLRDAPAEKLALAVQRTNGFPRALEAVAGLLLEDPLLSLDELLDDMALFSGEITPVIVQSAIGRLSAHALRVMEALSLFRRPVPQTALAYLLAPYLDTSALRTILARLVRGYFASYNKVTQEFAIHPIDREYCYSLIPEGQPGDISEANPLYTRFALHQRAADYYKHQRKPDEEEFQTFDDVAPYLAEFDHRVSAADYNTAAAVFQEITLDGLFVWGMMRLVVRNGESLQGKITDSGLNIRNLRFLGIAYSGIGLVKQAITSYEQSLDLARQLGNRREEGAALNALGQTYSDLAQTARASEYFEQALAIARETGNRRGEGLTLNNLGLSYNDLAQTARATEHFEQALVIAREMHNRPMEGLVICNLGRVLIDEGRYEEAIQRVEPVLEMNRELNSPEIGSYSNDLIARAKLFLGSLAEARQSAEAARQFDDPRNNHDALVALGIIALQQGDRIAAQQAFSAVTHIYEGMSPDLQDYTVLNAKALAWCGLLLCDNTTPNDAALEACRVASKTIHDAGVVARMSKLFDLLTNLDTAGLLVPLRAALLGA